MSFLFESVEMVHNVNGLTKMRHANTPGKTSRINIALSLCALCVHIFSK